MKLRTLLLWGFALCGLVITSGPLMASPEDTINALYGTSAFRQEVTSDKLWSADPPGTTPQLMVDVKLSTVGPVEFGIVSAAGTNYSTFGAFAGTRTLGSSSGVLYNVSANGTRYNATSNNILVMGTDPTEGGISPFAWDVRTANFTSVGANNGINAPNNAGLFTSYTAPNNGPGNNTWTSYLNTNANLNGSNQFDSQRNDTNMVSYRLSDDQTTGLARYILFWELDGNPSDGYDLVVEVTGVKNPEPTSLALMGFGAAGLLGYRLRRRAAKVAATV